MLLYYISSSFKNSWIFDKADKRHENMIFSQVDANYDKIVVKFDSDSNTKRKNCIVQCTLYLSYDHNNKMAYIYIIYKD